MTLQGFLMFINRLFQTALRDLTTPLPCVAAYRQPFHTLLNASIAIGTNQQGA
jgi:hypothetical protein